MFDFQFEAGGFFLLAPVRAARARQVVLADPQARRTEALLAQRFVDAVIHR